MQYSAELVPNRHQEMPHECVITDESKYVIQTLTETVIALLLFLSSMSVQCVR